MSYPMCVSSYTVVAISIRSSNFGWARPNRVVSQAVFQKIAAGHPKSGSEREVRSSPWEFSALTASRLDAPRVPKNSKGKRFSWPHRRAAHTGHTHRDERPGGPRGPAVPPPAPQHRERASLQPPAGERACSMSSIRNLSWPSQRRFQKFEKSVRSLN